MKVGQGQMDSEAIEKDGFVVPDRRKAVREVSKRRAEVDDEVCARQTMLL